MTRSELFLDELRTVLGSEKQWHKAVPSLSRLIRCEDANFVVGDHVVRSDEQLARLERVFGLLQKPARAKTCPVTALLLEAEAGRWAANDKADVRDAAVIALAQKVMHYQIAMYGSLCSWARQLGYEEASSLLDDSLKSCQHADYALTQLAETAVPLSPIRA